MTSRVNDITVLERPSSRGKSESGSLAVAGHPRIRFVTYVNEFVGAKPNLVVECARHGAVGAYVPSLLEAGYDVIVASVGAFSDRKLHSQIERAACKGNARIIIPNGAIGGLDILGSVSQMGDIKLTYRGVKPAGARLGTPAQESVDLKSLKEPVRFFSGTGREAALAFPKNANVVAALTLAGGGFDEMVVKLVADPHAKTNEHSYSVISDHCRYSMTIEASP